MGLGVCVAQGVGQFAAQAGELGLEPQLGRTRVGERDRHLGDDPAGRALITSTRVLRNTASLMEWVMNSPAKR